MDWLTSPRITGVIIATAFFILVTIPKPAAGAVLSKGAKDNVDIREKLKLIGQLSNGTGLPLVAQDEKCLLDLVSCLGLDEVWGFLTDEEMYLLILIWELDKKLGIPIIDTPQKDVCYTKGCLEAAYELLQAMDASADPCKDFYQYSCGRWIANNPVPDTTTRWNRFTVLRKKVNEFTQKLLSGKENNADALPINQAKQFYKACINVDATEADGLQPLRDIIAEFGGWPLLNPEEWDEHKFDWVKVAAEVRRQTGASAVISAYVYPDARDRSRSVIYIGQPSFRLPRSILIAPDEYPGVIEGYKNYIKNIVLELELVLEQDRLHASVEEIIKLEGLLAGREVKGDEEDSYHSYTLSEYQSVTNGIEPEFLFWEVYLNQLFRTSEVKITGNEPIVVRDLDYYERVIPILKKTSPSTLANYVMFRLVDGLIPYTTENMRSIVFVFEQVQTGVKEPKSRQVSCADFALSAFGMAISVEYVDTEFDEDVKDETDKMVKIMIDSFKGMVGEEKWMGDESKKAAIVKADAIHPLTAYPVWLKDKDTVEGYYQGLQLKDSYFQSQVNINIYKKDKELNTLRMRTDRDEWIDDPTTVNAFYSETQNTILFTAAILQPPFIGKDRPKSQNYGLMGSVTSHEILHAFDSTGSQFDEKGNLKDLFDLTTQEKFNERAECMADQYSGFYVYLAKKNINGWLTLAENIADNGGIRVAYRSYQNYILVNGKEKKLPGLESLTPNKLFFLAYANLWCESITARGLEIMILTDPHSPTEFRVKGVLRNFNEFAQAFNCPVEGENEDGMNPPKEEKCEVW